VQSRPTLAELPIAVADAREPGLSLRVGEFVIVAFPDPGRSASQAPAWLVSTRRFETETSVEPWREPLPPHLVALIEKAWAGR
jgi:hypothetical protein